MIGATHPPTPIFRMMPCSYLPAKEKSEVLTAISGLKKDIVEKP
jgi:hypothetical protein